MEKSPPDNVVALSRFRAQLGRGRRARSADELFDAPDPARAIRGLPADELYYIVAEMGFPDALEILRHASAEQVQVALDFAVWDRDQLAPERVEEWLAALVDIPEDQLGSLLRRLDVELVALLLRKRMRIYDLSIEEPPDQEEGVLFNTPDRLFALDLLGDEDAVRVTGRLLTALYAHDLELARRLLVGVRSELDNELEDMAYRWRSGRMSDLGFIDFYEALEVYRELDPASVRVGGDRPTRVRPTSEPADESHLRVPTALADRLRGATPFARAVAGVGDPEELAELRYALMALSNRVLSADRVAPGDEDAVAAALERVSATLDIATEFLARGSGSQAVTALRTVPLVHVFRLGVSLIAKVKRLSLALKKQTPFARLGAEVSLFEDEDAEVLAALTRPRPQFPRILDVPPSTGWRPFASLADIATAMAAVERAGAAVAMLYALGIRPETLAELDPATLDTGAIARTVLVRRLVEDEAAPLRPLDVGVLSELQRRFGGRDDKLKAAAHALLAQACAGGVLTAATAAVADRWASSLAPLGTVVTARDFEQR